MHIEIDSRVPGCEEFARLALRWISGTSKLVGLDTENLPSSGLIPFIGPSSPSDLWLLGEPTALAATIYVQLLPEFGLGRRAKLTPSSWRKVSEALVEKSPYSILLVMSPIRDSGIAAGRGLPVNLEVSRVIASPEWVRFEAQLPGDIVPWHGENGRESSWLAFVRDWVSEIPASFAHIDDKGNFLRTSDEAPFGRYAWDTVPHSEERLRGSSWVTVVPAGLAETLGGGDALVTSGAFVEVTPVAGGSLFLRATPTIDDYDLTAAARAFSALAPALLRQSDGQERETS